jgi:hypothetical protein
MVSGLRSGPWCAPVSRMVARLSGEEAERAAAGQWDPAAHLGVLAQPQLAQ